MEAASKNSKNLWKIVELGSALSEFVVVNAPQKKWRKWRPRLHFLAKTVECLQFVNELSRRLQFVNEFRGTRCQSGGSGGGRLQDLQTIVGIHSHRD